MSASITTADYAALVEFVNGTATEPERSRMERGVREREDLRLEYRYLLRLRRAVHQPLTPAPGDFGLDRLNQSIEEAEAGQRHRNWKARILNTLQRLFGPDEG
jgi:hypothetical protein